MRMWALENAGLFVGCVGQTFVCISVWMHLHCVRVYVYHKPGTMMSGDWDLC